MKQIRVGVLGQGRSGRDIHSVYLREAPRMYKIVAIVDPIEERRIRAEKEFDCKTYSDYHQLFDLNDIDLIVNATPSHLHVSITLEFLNKGFNVLCEKPLARKVSEVDGLIEASKKSKKLLAIFQQVRYSKSFQKVKEVIDSGVLGRIINISIFSERFSRRWDWQTLQDYNGGSLLNTGPHSLDQALYLFGFDVMPEVCCSMDRANTYGDAEDFVKYMFKAPGHPLMDITVSECCLYPQAPLVVQGTQGGLIINSNREVEWKYYKPEEAPSQHLIHEPLSKPDGTPAYCSEELKMYEEKWTASENENPKINENTHAFYSMLYKSLTEGSPLKTTPEQIRLQIAIIEECHRQNSQIYGSALE